MISTQAEMAPFSLLCNAQFCVSGNEFLTSRRFAGEIRGKDRYLVT